MLEYENQMFLDVLHEDGLVVAAKGLGVETVFLNLLKVYSDAGNLVIVIGTTGKEEEFYLSQLEQDKVKPLPKVITAEYLAAERESVYLQGGVLFVTSRILVVDLLKNRLPIDHVTGFLVCRAHGILESCQEAFALRLYRQKNKTGFIKAFSSSAQSFTAGFAQVGRIMRSLFVRNLYLWPRFHANVNSSLNKFKPGVVELHIQMTPMMVQIQNALLDLMNFCVRDMKRINPTLELEELNVENAISKSFHKVLQLQLDPIWHQLSSQTKQLVADLKTLRHVLSYLTRYDSVTFYSLVKTLRTVEYALKSSGWRLLDSAETLFLVAEQRIMGKMKALENADADPEPSPKWLALTEILIEINEACKTSEMARECDTSGTTSNKILILVEDMRICNQLKQYLTMGGSQMLQERYRKVLKRHIPYVSKMPVQPPAEEEVADSSLKVKVEVEDVEDEENFLRESYTLSQKLPTHNEETDSVDVKPCYEELEETEVKVVIEEDTRMYVPPVLVIQTFKKYGDPLALAKTLRELDPTYVVLYDADMASIRRLEVHQCENPQVQLKVFFLMYGSSVEEQAYLTTLRREKQAFEFLIKEKSTMVIPENQDGKGEDCNELSRDAAKPSETVNTRRGGGTEQQTKSRQPTVIVDMREFRSELPALIHKRGLEVEPVTLQVGDYILTPEICIERKSVSDLIGSLNSGRLYHQALIMTRHYPKPMLLIEFDQNKPFALQGQYYVSNDVSSKDVSAKLLLLTLHFPKLRLVWSPSPTATSQLFEELKQGRAEPDAVTAAAIGAELEQELDTADKYNSAIHDLVSKLPGITTKNIRLLLNKGKSLDHLLTLSKEELKAIIGNGIEAEKLHDALHKVHRATETSIGRGGRGGRYRGRGFGRRRN